MRMHPKHLGYNRSVVSLLFSGLMVILMPFGSSSLLVIQGN